MHINRLIMLAVVICTTLFLTSCRTPYIMYSIGKLRPGMDENKVLEIVLNEPSFVFSANPKSDVKRTFKVLVFVDPSSPEGGQYAAFEDNKLYYWGRASEFNRHPDVLLNEIIALTVDAKRRKQAQLQ